MEVNFFDVQLSSITINLSIGSFEASIAAYARACSYVVANFSMFSFS